MALQAAKELVVQRSSLVWLIFNLRTLAARLREGSVRWESPRLVDWTLAIGWGALADAPGLYVAGAVTQPWKAEVEFRPLPPEEFAAFDEPVYYAKIVWTLEAEELPGGESIAPTRTRVKTTDSSARRRFRGYWATLWPGILVIRYEMLRLVRCEADRRLRQRSPRYR